MATIIGMIDSAYFVGRSEILAWINSTHLNLSKVEEETKADPNPMQYHMMKTASRLIYYLLMVSVIQRVSSGTSMLDILEWTLDVIGVTYRLLDGRYFSVSFHFGIGSSMLFSSWCILLLAFSFYVPPNKNRKFFPPILAKSSLISLQKLLALFIYWSSIANTPILSSFTIWTSTHKSTDKPRTVVTVSVK